MNEFYCSCWLCAVKDGLQINWMEDWLLWKAHVHGWFGFLKS